MKKLLGVLVVVGLGSFAHAKPLVCENIKGQGYRVVIDSKGTFAQLFENGEAVELNGQFVIMKCEKGQHGPVVSCDFRHNGEFTSVSKLVGYGVDLYKNESGNGYNAQLDERLTKLGKAWGNSLGQFSCK